MLTLGSVCSGIGGAEMAFEGIARSVFASEVEAFPRKVLTHRFPGTPLHGDFTRLADDPPDVDILVGGTPCQSFSVAGLRGSMADARGNLTLAYAMLLNALDDKRKLAGKPPAACLWENVPGVLSVPDNAFGCFLAGLVGADRPLDPAGRRGKWGRAGLVVGPRRSAAWRVLDAQWFGVAQRRNRVFVVAGAGDGFDPVEVLFEREGVQRRSPPSRQAREAVAGTLGARASAGGGFGTDFDLGGGLTRGPELYRLCTANTDVRQAAARVFTSAALAASCDRIGNSGTQVVLDGTGRGTPTGARSSSSNLCADYRLHGYGSSAMTGNGAAAAAAETDVARALGTCGGFSAAQGGNLVVFGWQNSPSQGDSVSEHAAPALDKGKTPAALHGHAVRRLTPKECERLQGFPDSHTGIPGAKDSPRYKALGNAFCVPVVRWIAKRLAAEIDRNARSLGCPKQP